MDLFSSLRGVAPTTTSPQRTQRLSWPPCFGGLANPGVFSYSLFSFQHSWTWLYRKNRVVRGFLIEITPQTGPPPQARSSSHTYVNYSKNTGVLICLAPTCVPAVYAISCSAPPSTWFLTKLPCSSGVFLTSGSSRSEVSLIKLSIAHPLPLCASVAHSM